MFLKQSCFKVVIAMLNVTFFYCFKPLGFNTEVIHEGLFEGMLLPFILH